MAEKWTKAKRMHFCTQYLNNGVRESQLHFLCLFSSASVRTSFISFQFMAVFFVSVLLLCLDKSIYADWVS